MSGPQLNFGGANAFTVSTLSAAPDAIATTLTSATNNGVYSYDGNGTYVGKTETLTFQNGTGTANVTLSAADTLNTAIA